MLKSVASSRKSNGLRGQGLPPDHPLEALPKESIKAFLVSDLSDLEVADDFYSFVNALYCVHAIDGSDFEKFISVAETGELKEKIHKFNGKELPPNAKLGIVKKKIGLSSSGSPGTSPFRSSNGTKQEAEVRVDSPETSRATSPAVSPRLPIHKRELSSKPIPKSSLVIEANPKPILAIESNSKPIPKVDSNPKVAPEDESNPKSVSEIEKSKSSSSPKLSNQDPQTSSNFPKDSTPKSGHSHRSNSKKSSSSKHNTPSTNGSKPDPPASSPSLVSDPLKSTSAGVTIFKSSDYDTSGSNSAYETTGSNSEPTSPGSPKSSQTVSPSSSVPKTQSKLAMLEPQLSSNSVIARIMLTRRQKSEALPTENLISTSNSPQPLSSPSLPTSSESHTESSKPPTNVKSTNSSKSKPRSQSASSSSHHHVSKSRSKSKSSKQKTPESRSDPKPEEKSSQPIQPSPESSPNLSGSKVSPKKETLNSDSPIIAEKEASLQENSVLMAPSPRVGRLRKNFSQKTLDSMFQNSSPKDRYKFLVHVGSGAYGSVYVCKPKYKTETKRVAIKVITNAAEKSKAIQSVAREITTIRECQHRNIIQHIESFKHKKDLYVVLEFCDGDTLKKLLKFILNDKQMAYFCKQILLGLDHLHSLHKVHRDIKSDNILLNLDGSLKIADFGLCAAVPGPRQLTAMCGTKFWMSPEMLRGTGYDQCSDIYSFSCVIHEMVTGDPPRVKLHPLKALFYTATKGAVSLEDTRTTLSEELLDFYKKASTFHANKRPKASQLLEHSWLDNAASPEEAKRLLHEAFVVNRTDDLFNM